MTKLFDKIKDVVRHQSGGLTYRKKLNHDYESVVLFDYKDGVGTIEFKFRSPQKNSQYISMNHVEKDMSQHYEGTEAWDKFKRTITDSVVSQLKERFKNNDDVSDDDINNYMK